MERSGQSQGFDLEFWIKVEQALDESDLIMDALKRITHQVPDQDEINDFFDTTEHDI